METTVNEEYQKLIDLIEEVRSEGRFNPSTDGKLITVQRGIKNLGTRPVLAGNVQSFMNITNAMAKTYAAKNHDYGDSFKKSLDEFGLVAAVVRIGDKMNRIKSLIINKAEVRGESIQDTLLDMANYCIMTVMWVDRIKEN